MREVITRLAALTVFSGFSLNLLLHFALGLRGIAERNRSFTLPFFQMGVLFSSTFILWLIFTRFPIPLPGEFLEYFLCFPLFVLLSLGLELFFRRILPGFSGNSRVYNPLTAYEGLGLAALIFTLRLAFSLAEAAALAFSFSAGVLLSMLVLREIRNRALLERVPGILRGTPLVFISMGLLSLILSSIMGILFKILEIF
jgi:Na+-translocating ferredoxin:NAD+ oxidoreductase RnfA subunit